MASAGSVFVSAARTGEVPDTRNLAVGAGILGGGTLAADRTFTMGFASEAQGDIAIRGASAWQRLGTGTVGSALIAGGAGANPAWGTDFGASNLATTGTLAVGSSIGLGGGTQPTTGLLRFPKPSEQSTLAVFRREASAVNIPFITVDTSSGLTIGDISSGAMPSLYLKAGTNVDVLAAMFTMRETAGTTRCTFTIAAASIWNIAASTSLAFQYATTERFKIDSTGISWFGVTTVARAAAITQTFSTTDRTIANPTAVSVATTGSALASYGYTQAQADAIVTNLNALIVDVATLKQNLNAVVDDLQAYGLEQ